MASFRKRSNGWEYRISYKKPDGTFGSKSKGGFANKTLAKAASIKAEQKLLNNAMEDENITLYNFSKTWAEIYKRPYVTDKTWQTYYKNLKHIKNYFGDIKLKAVTHTYYQQKLNDFGKTYAQETLEKFHYQIKGAAKVAVRERLILTNFADGAIVKSQKPKRPADNSFLEEHEYLALINHTRSHIQYVTEFTLYLIAVTGMRFSEALGLTWKDIDFENGIININKTFDYSITQDFAPTKNQQSIRQIPVDKNTLNILKDYKQNYYQENKLGRICYGTSNSYTNRKLKQLVGRDVHNHSLRHTYASFLILKGIDLISISQLLGHENLNITLKVYAHQLEKLKEKNNEQIKQIFEQV
ncbi:MAG: tyrosine-type recombinase/integrase [Streptococcus orisratti]|uniref:site-specific integrase n=1 Tax=Streptococcus orisratti TaxID=114652 RepID=UPI002A91072E|nr:tyrosine-type recombinase/integrase [Streptococcus orisratti]MDY5636496.1 tyrosine-type recombinase/integrase [Streptococcus orisratti]